MRSTPLYDGDLQQQVTHSNKNQQLSPKTKRKTKSEPTSPEKLRSALKGKQKIFYLESKSGRSYIVDSGASFHLVSRDELTDQEKTIIALNEPIPIQTANGEVELNEKFQIFVRDLKVRVWAHILPDTVAVLSLGLLVEELRFSYVWNPGRCPFLRRGNLTVTSRLSAKVLLLMLMTFLEQRVTASNKDQLALMAMNLKDLLH